MVRQAKKEGRSPVVSCGMDSGVSVRSVEAAKAAMRDDREWSEEMDDRYEAFRNQIEHEDHLIGMRVSWLMAAEAFLFAGYAAVLAVPTRQTLAGFESAAHRLYTVLPVVGILLAVLVFIAVWAAIARLEELRAQSKKAGTVCGYPKITSRKIQRWPGRLPGMVAPVIVTVAWCFARW